MPPVMPPCAQVKVLPPELKAFMDKKLSSACRRAPHAARTAEPTLPSTRAIHH